MYYGYHTVFLKQNRETFTHNFRRFSADFSAQFAKIAGEIAKSVQNLRENCAENARNLHKLHAN